MHLTTHAQRELLPLTDSLSSVIRWRYGDYEAMLRAEVDMLLRSRSDDAPLSADATDVDREDA